MNYEPIPGVMVVGISGKARHGKDTTGGELQEYFGRDARRYGFADALKGYCRVVCGMTVKDPATLQRMGQYMRDEHDPEIWNRALYYTIQEQCPRIAIVTDVRHVNEVKLVRAMEGFLIRVTRTTKSGDLFVSPDRAPNHISEIALDSWHDWDAEIQTDNVATLCEAAKDIAERVDRIASANDCKPAAGRRM